MSTRTQRTKKHANLWVQHVREIHARSPDVSFGECMKIASRTWKTTNGPTPDERESRLKEEMEMDKQKQKAESNTARKIPKSRKRKKKTPEVKEEEE